jgi:hypothetical protein
MRENKLKWGRMDMGGEGAMVKEENRWEHRNNEREKGIERWKTHGKRQTSVALAHQTT